MQHDIRPQDVFVVADLDELLSREFLAALKHCEVHPEMEQPGGGCSKVVALTFGHKVSVRFAISALALSCACQRVARPSQDSEVVGGHGGGSTRSIAQHSDRRATSTPTSPWASVCSSSAQRNCA